MLSNTLLWLLDKSMIEPENIVKPYEKHSTVFHEGIVKTLEE